MKKYLIAALSSVILANTAFADAPLVQSKVTGTQPTQYICISSLGCLNIAQIKTGRKFPLGSGDIGYIFLSDIKTLRMYPQKLPASCQITVPEDKTLIISGHVSKAANDNMYISHLKCSVAA